MALNARQTKLYIHTCHVYTYLQPADRRFGTYDIEPLKYNPTPVYTNKNFYYQTAPEIHKGKFFGRHDKEDTESLLDMGHFEVSTAIKQNDVILITSTDHPFYNTYFIVVGRSRPKNVRANKLSVFLKEIDKPAGLT